MLEQILVNYTDAISSFAIPMVIAIFALAFPLLFQTASRIDDKYNSTLLIKVFRKDWICKCFIYTLLSALICCGLWILQLPRLIDCINCRSCRDDNMLNVVDVCLLYA